MDSRLEAALHYASVGWAVFPVNANKVPAIKDWENNASTDPKQIEAWFNATVDGCNFGFPPGRAGIAVIDCDTHGGDGQSNLDRFQDENFCFLPATLTVRTPSGGKHYYYKASGLRSKNGFLPAVDVKSNGGYVVIAGSKTDKGEYIIEKAPGVSELPVAFRNYYVSKTERATTEPVSDTPAPGNWTDFASILAELNDMDTIEEGRRDNTLIAMALDWKERGVDQQGIYQLLNAANAMGKIAAGDSPLTDRDFRRIANSAWKKASAVAGSRSVTALFGGDENRHGYSAADLVTMDIPEVQYLVDGLLPMGMSFIGGAPKSGKTYLALQLAVALASGEDFLGHASTQCKVLYCYLEGGQSQVKRRLTEIYGEKFTPPRDLFLVHELPALDAGGVRILGELIKDTKPTAVFIDTWQKVRVDGAATGVTAYQKEYKELNALQVSVMDQYNVPALILVHHLKQFKRGEITDGLAMLNGSAALSGASDSVWLLIRERGADTARLECHGRDIEDVDIELVKTDPMGWEVSQNNNSIEVVPETTLQSAIYNALSAHPDGLTAREVCERCPGIKYNSVLIQLNRWASSGKIDKSGKKFRLFNVRVTDAFDDDPEE